MGGLKLNKTMIKILISALILLIGIGAVSAMEHNSTDEFMSVEQSDEISVMEDNNTVVSIGENDSDVLSAEDNNTVVSVSVNDSDVLSAEKDNTVVSVSNDEDLTSYSPFAIEPQMTEHKTQYKTFYAGKMVFSKKYKKMALYGYNKPSKKNKKAWKKHVAYQKAYKKQFKRFIKTTTKIANKAKANHWHALGDMYYKIKYSAKYVYIRFYVDCYRTYNYNPLLNKGWWD